MMSLIIFGSSCKKDFVYLNNPNQQTNGTFWKTADDALAGINAVYSTLYYDGLYMRVYPWEMDVRADDEYNTSPWWTLETSKYIYTPGDPCVEEPWQYNYIGIFRANQVLSYVPGIDMDTTLKNRILGEAKFLRGLFYYHLVVLYKNVPIITTLPQGQSDEFPKQSPDSLTWRQIINDFSAAMSVLPTKQKYNGVTDMGRATCGAAAAFLAKSLMFTKQWDKAAPILKNIIDQKLGTYSIMANYKDNFTIDYPNNSESLFEIQFDKNVGGTTLGWVGSPSATWSKTDGYAYGIADIPFGYGNITPTDWIYLEFQKEKTVDSLPDPRLEASLFYQHFLKGANGKDSLDNKGNPISDSTYLVYGLTWQAANMTKWVGNKYDIHVRKYLNDETEKNEKDWRSGIHRRIFRYAEVLLLYAECLNEMNQTVDAYSYIQQVRDRAKLPNLLITKPGLTQDQMRDQIAHERALELCFEAERYYDILRWGWFTDASKLAILVQHDPEFNLYSAGHEYFPIPQYEMYTNTNLVQNPGWTGN